MTTQKKRNNEDYVEDQALSNVERLFFTEHEDGRVYEYYLMGRIGDPENYLDLCMTLRTAKADDQVIIRINSLGGQVRTGSMIINAIKESEATVLGFIEADCGSMATFIFLACDAWAASPYAEWFSHTFSSGNFGKESETFESAQFMRKQTHKRIREEYHGFLTEEEIAGVLQGTDIYLDADEVMDRTEAFSRSRGVPEQEVEPTIEQMIDNAVQNGVKNGILQALESQSATKYVATKSAPTKRRSKTNKTEE